MPFIYFRDKSLIFPQTKRSNLIDDDYYGNLDSPVVRASYLNKLKTRTKLPRERIPTKFLQKKLMQSSLSSINQYKNLEQSL